MHGNWFLHIRLVIGHLTAIQWNGRVELGFKYLTNNNLTFVLVHFQFWFVL